VDLATDRAVTIEIGRPGHHAVRESDALDGARVVRGLTDCRQGFGVSPGHGYFSMPGLTVMPEP